MDLVWLTIPKLYIFIKHIVPALVCDLLRPGETGDAVQSRTNILVPMGILVRVLRRRMCMNVCVTKAVDNCADVSR